MPSLPSTISPLAQFVAKRVDELKSRRSQREIATIAGFESANFITMLKMGTAKLPLDRVEALADALDTDPHKLMRLALRQFFDEHVIRVIERSAPREADTPDETRLSKEVNHALSSISVDIVGVSVRGALMTDEVTAAKKLLTELRNRLDQIDDGLAHVKAETKEAVSQLRTLGVGQS